MPHGKPVQKHFAKAPSHWLAIILAAAFVSWWGGQLTMSGMVWYETIALPPWTPPDAVFGVVWSLIFILAALSTIIYFRRATRDRRFDLTVTTILFNAGLNVFWSYLFFVLHEIGAAVIDAALLGATVVVLITLVAPVSRKAAWLLVPYAAWVAFATYLNYVIWTMNA
jgi:tryptophan-rich sensory protein